MVTPLVKQCWTVSGVLLNLVNLGMIIAYPSCLAALSSPPPKSGDRSGIHLDLNSASWLASSVGISSAFGFLATSVLMEVFGRKKTHLLTVMPSAVGWILIYFATNFTTLMIGRLFTGFSGGATVTLGAIVIGEFTSPEYRGLFLNLKTAAACLGSLVLHIAGHYLHWRTVALVALIPTVLALAVICTWPESPSWLVVKNKLVESEKAFYWLRGKDENSVREYEALVRSQKETLATTSDEVAFFNTVGYVFKKLTRKDFLQPIAIIFLAFVVLEACGRHTFPAFALDIIGEISGDKSQTFLYTICMDIIVTLSAILACILVQISRRRTLLFFSGISSIVVLLGVSLYLYLASTGVISKDRAWIPLSMLVVYCFVSNLGCTSIPLALLGEIFPLAHRSAGSALSGITISFNLTAALQITPMLMAAINSYGTFAVSSLVMIVALSILYFILPETKDKTLQEIEDYFNNGKLVGKDHKSQEESVKMIEYKA